MLMVTHDLELARQIPRVIEIRDGRITRDEATNCEDRDGRFTPQNLA
jgi:ABC-type lipoprotein export system ATPase subunit